MEYRGYLIEEERFKSAVGGALVNHKKVADPLSVENTRWVVKKDGKVVVKVPSEEAARNWVDQKLGSKQY